MCSRERDREQWARREGVWDEAEELVDEPPLPERVGRKVRRASREIGEDVSSEVEKLGGRLRGWSQDVGRTAERFTEDLGDGIQRAGRSGRRWIGGDDDDRAGEAALYDVDVDEGTKRKMTKEEMKKTKEKKVRPRVAEIEREMGLKKENEEEEGRKGWSWLGWGRRSEEEERLPEDRIADVKFKVSHTPALMWGMRSHLVFGLSLAERCRSRVRRFEHRFRSGLPLRSKVR